MTLNPTLVLLIFLCCTCCKLGLVLGDKCVGCGLCLEGVNMNYTAVWEPVPNADSSPVNYTLVQDMDNVICETDKTSCFLGSAIFAGKSKAFVMIFLELSVDPALNQSSCRLSLFQAEVTVGPPDIIETTVMSRNVSFTIRGPRTPLSGTVYMGQRKAGRDVLCNASLTHSQSGAVIERKPQVKLCRDDSSCGQRKGGEAEINFDKLDPFTTYTVEIQCTISDKLSNNVTVYQFTTHEDVPATGPHILKPLSIGLGCEDRDLRNVIIDIQPPPVIDRNGRLLWYEIRYRKVNIIPEFNNWVSEVVILNQSIPAFYQYTIEAISRWDTYEIVVFANNSIGGFPSSTHQLGPLQLKEVESRPVNLTKREVRPKVWMLRWYPPWPLNMGDCIAYYAVATEGRLLANVNNTNYTIDTNVNGHVGDVMVTAVMYNGTGPVIRGMTATVSVASPSSSPRVVIIAVGSILSLLFIVGIICVLVCMYHGPRWPESFDLRNNSLLKTALALGELRPKVSVEREEFNSLVEIRPPPTTSETGTTTALIEKNSLSQEGAPSNDASQGSPLMGRDLSTSSTVSVDDAINSSQSSLNDSAAESGSPGATSQYDSGLVSAMASGDETDQPGYPVSFLPSGYVKSPQLPTLINPIGSNPPATSGYFTFEDVKKMPPVVVIDTDDAMPCIPSSDTGNAIMNFNPNGPINSQSGFGKDEHVTNAASELLTNIEIAMQSMRFMDCEFSLCHLAPSNLEGGDGVDSYTKLSRPNTPQSKRDKVYQIEETMMDVAENNASVGFSGGQLGGSQPGLTHVG